MPSESWGTVRHIGLILVLGFWLAACGGKSQSQPPAVFHGDTSQLFASGTRLKAHYLDGGGGARKLLAFHDSLLDMECQFVETAAGLYACLPLVSTRTFSDSACSAPTFPVASACPQIPAPVAGQVISAPSSDCAAQVGAYSLEAPQGDGAQDQSSSLSIYGNCSSPSLQSGPSAQWTTKPESISRFVQGAASTFGAAGGLQATRVIGEDGAFTTLELVTAGAPCIPIPFGKVERCVPEPLAQRFSDSYTDASCTDASVALVGITIAQRCAGTQPQYLVESVNDNCYEGSTLYALGDPLSRVFADPSSCAAVDLDKLGSPSDSFYRIGPLVSADVLSVAHSARIGTGALTVGYYADSADTPILARGNLARPGDWALADGSQCTVLQDPNGQLRCAHHALIVDSPTYYADANCTEPLYNSDLACALTSIAYLVKSASDGCSPRLTQAYAAKVYSGPHYSIQSGVCQLYPYSNTNPYLSTGAPVDNRIFPLITDATDP